MRNRVCKCCGNREWNEEREERGEATCDCDGPEWVSPLELTLAAGIYDALYQPR